MKRDNKSDVLYLVMGTNPFPNLISAITRIEGNGIIVCLCTDKTRTGPYGRFKKVVTKRLKNIEVSYVVVNGYDRDDIDNAISKDLEQRVQKADKDILIELNYTGGTKVMSSAAYETIRNYDFSKSNIKSSVILSYIDSERELMCYEYKAKYMDYYIPGFIKLEDLDKVHEYKLFDIISAYNISLKNEEKIKTEVTMKDLSMDMGNLFSNIDKITYDKHISFIKRMNYYLYDIRKNSKNNISNHIAFKLKLDKLLCEKNLPFKYKKSDDFGFESDKGLYDYFNETRWLEEYIFSVFLDLKSEGVIDDVVANYEKKESEKENNFEVDIVAYKKYRLYAVSITSASDSKKEHVEGKLYEIKQRARDLAGDETGICYINLCWEVDFLKDEIINTWDNSNAKNLLILGAKSFGNLKEEIKVWITRSGFIE